MLPSEVPRLATDSPVRMFPGVWKLLSFLRLPSWDRSLSLPLLSLFFNLLYFFLPPFEDNGLLFWVPDVLCRHSEVVCGIYSAFKCSFDEFVGEKVVSLSYSSAILGPPPELSFRCSIGATGRTRESDTPPPPPTPRCATLNKSLTSRGSVSTSAKCPSLTGRTHSIGSVYTVGTL